MCEFYPSQNSNLERTFLDMKNKLNCVFADCIFSTANAFDNMKFGETTSLLCLTIQEVDILARYCLNAEQ